MAALHAEVLPALPEQHRQARAAARAVVRIRALEPAPGGGTGGDWSALGFVVDDRGHVLTHDDLLDGAGAVEVTLQDGRRVPAKMIARDPLNHVAILKVEVPRLPALALGESSMVRVGEAVMAVRAPFGGEPEPAVGTIRATGAATGGELATGLRLAPHDSGGPVINSRGDVVGIVARGAGATPAGALAVPIDRVKPMLRWLSARPSSAHRTSDPLAGPRPSDR